MALLRFFSPASDVVLRHVVLTCSSYRSYLSRFQSWVASKPYTTWIQPLVTRCNKPSEIGCQEPNMDLKAKTKHDQTWFKECYRNILLYKLDVVAVFIASMRLIKCQSNMVHCHDWCSPFGSAGVQISTTFLYSAMKPHWKFHQCTVHRCSRGIRHLPKEPAKEQHRVATQVVLGSDGDCFECFSVLRVSN